MGLEVVCFFASTCTCFPFICDSCILEEVSDRTLYYIAPVCIGTLKSGCETPSTPVSFLLTYFIPIFSDIHLPIL